MTTPTQWQRISRLLDEVLDRPPEEQQAFLDKACADDPQLRQHVQDLLDHQTEAEAAIGESVSAFVPDLLPDLHNELANNTDETDLHEQRIGPYRLLRRLGRGGMGTVYLAQRDDGQFHKQVALKLIRRGLDTDDILSRFRYERQILASLDHPHIARLYDGGMTDDGRPYFVMEYVEGEPITAYCDAHRLTTKQRLALFRTVCRAVQYAHQNLIIHRDLKPSNILVTEDGTVKLLDFGIAKLLNDEGIEQTAPQTAMGMRLMTPEYAAPEQVRGEPVTTATDVYQLGVLLYELLTGHRPYRMQSRVQAEVERVILEEEPTRPSTALTHAEEASQAYSAARGTTVERLRRQLAGDLDNIVLMALKKEPARRYGTVEQFSEDLRRYLSGLTVIARRDTLRYRTTKFVLRHRGGLGLAMGLALLLIGFGLYHTNQVTLERNRAQDHAAKAEQINAFVLGLFAAGHSFEERTDTLRVRTVLDRGVARISEQLAGQPERQAVMLQVVGNVFFDLGAIGRAEEVFEQALDLRRGVSTAPSPELIESLYYLGRSKTENNAPQAADSLLQQALAMHQALGFERDSLFAQLLYARSWATYYRMDFAQAVALMQEAHDIFRDVLGETHPSTLEAQSIQAGIMAWIPTRREEALALMQDALEQMEATQSDSSYDVIQTRLNLAEIHNYLGHNKEARILVEQVLDYQRRALGSDHHEVGFTLHVLGYILYDEGEYQRAEQVFEEMLSIFRQTRDPSEVDVGLALTNLAEVAYAQQRFTIARARYQEALTNFHSLTPDDPRRAPIQEGLGRVALAQGALREAESYLREALALREKSPDDDSGLKDVTGMLLGTCLTRQRRFAEAETLLEQSYANLKAMHDPSHRYLKESRSALLELYEAWGKPDKAADYRALLHEATP